MSTTQLNRIPDRPTVSIIITNHNYASFLRDAIESALGQDYDNVQVIVVDDGSTDASRSILREYEERVDVVLKDNGGQSSSFNAGYLEARGDLIMTLDADDMLESFAISRVVKAWTPEIGEVHFPLSLINQDGSFRPGRNPTARVASGDLAAVLLEKGRYIGPPSSGNVYSRSVLDAIVPIPEGKWRHSDCYLETLGPFYGSVRALEEPLGRYRIHSSNISTVKDLDRHQIEVLINHDLMQNELLVDFCARNNLQFRPGTGLSHWGHLKLTLALERMLGSPSRRQTCWRFLRSVWRSKDELTWSAKFRLIVWALSTTLLPGPAGRALVLLAFSRPQFRKI